MKSTALWRFNTAVDSGATLSDLQEAVDEAKPSSIYHTATRPETLTVDLSATVLVDPAADVTAATVESNVAEYLSSLGLGEALRNGPLGAAIMDAASGVEDHDDLMVDVVGESYTYQSGTSDYPLQQMATTEGVDTLTAIVGGSETILTEGTDYDVADTDSDGVPDTITFLSGGTSPDDGTDFDVSYGVSGDVEVSERGKIIAGEVAFTTEGL